MRRSSFNSIYVFGIGLFVSASLVLGAPAEKIRVGYFPNITHAQALVGLADGTFQRALGPEVAIETKVFNAGPSAVEALFAKAIDLAYIGPGPAINGYVRSGGILTVVAGSCSGGVALVVRDDVPIRTAADLRGKKLATPQLGNTQDIAARLYLKKNGLAPVGNGGDVQVLPIANPDQLTLFQRKNLDAAWAPEPWATRLVQEGHGRIFLDERALWPDRRFATTVIVVSVRFLEEHPDLVVRWLRGHREVTQWIQEHPAQARASAGREIQKITTKGLPDRILTEAWKRLDFTTDPIPASLSAMAESAYALGLLGREQPDVRGLVDLQYLDRAKASR